MKITNSKTAINLSGLGRQLTNEELNKLKSIELSILLDVKTICEKHGLKYFLIFGTLLGAIRHKGFIPWDDDIDICMFNDEILELISLLNVEFPNKYNVLGYMYNGVLDPFMGYKIMLNGTAFKEVECENFPYVRGINIDIFPIVSIPKTKLGRKLKFYQTRLLNVACSLRNEYRYSPDSLINSSNKDVKSFYKKRRLLSLPLLFLSNKTWQKIRKKCLFKKYKKSDYFAFEYTGYKSILIRKNDFESKNKVLFENYLFSTFENPVSFLEYWYGKTWNEIPPESKREKHALLDFKY